MTSEMTSSTADTAIVELRQYTLHPGRRDELIALFEDNFVESQESCGIRLIGLFRDLDNPDRFVWLRGFPDMPTRAAALAEFYDGPVWKQHRSAANVTLIDSDNVLLLRDAHCGSGFAEVDRALPLSTTDKENTRIVVATIYPFDAMVDSDFVDFFDSSVAPILGETGASILASLVTEESGNTFPRLPVREGEHVFVWLATFVDRAAFDLHRAALAMHPNWRSEIAPSLNRRLLQPPETLHLSPTRRSRLR
ncbi:MAG: NIPSNAP family protein [Dokdonella sp.]